MLTFTTQRDRDAWNTIRGYVYQVDLTIERWLNLQPGQTLELECGEDIDIVSRSLTATPEERQRLLEQVKHRDSSITLKSSEAVTAIACFIDHRQTNSSANLLFRFTTNTEVGKEKRSPMPNKAPAIVAWEQIRQGNLKGTAQNAALQGIRTILKNVKPPDKLHGDTSDIFCDFITNASDEQFLDLICSFEWSTKALPAKSLSSSLQELLVARKHARDNIEAQEQYRRLFLYVFKRLCERERKQLTLDELSSQLSLPTLSESDHQLLNNLLVWFHALEVRVQEHEVRLGVLEQHLDRERTETYIGQEVADCVDNLLRDYTKLFVGRETILKQLDEFLTQTRTNLLTLIAPAGFGKTALLANWVASRKNDGCFIVYHFFSQRYDVTRSFSAAYRNLLRQLYDYYEPSDHQIPNHEDGLRDKLYCLLKEYSERDGRPLVIVLDALDEAEPPLRQFLPLLPENVFLIASARLARAEEGQEPEYLRGWTDNALPICLDRLPKPPDPAIADWIRQAGEGELAAFAEDTHFVAQLDEITQGFPLYLRYLTEELIQAQQKGEDVQVVLTRSPKGFGAYVREQFKLLAKVKELRQRKVQLLFALLSVALGALSEDDIREITKLNEWDLAALPWQVTRWFSIQTGYYSFAHPLLAKEFQGVLPRQTSSAKEKLIKYCSRWQKHQSHYALRHYAEHLRDVKRWEDLYAIARNKDFASAQQKHLPDEPDLPLKTVQAALLGAAEKDDAGAMADFMLVHARRLEQTTVQESPLDALRSGNLTRALALADLYEIERCILWYLLLAWELKDEGKLEEAWETLERLQIKKLPRFSTNAATLWQGNYATDLLAYIFIVNKDICNFLVQQLFENYHRRYLCKILCEHDDFDAALETADTIDEEFERVLQLARIAKAQAGKGQKDTARSNFAKALKIIRQANLHILWVHEMVDIAKAQIEELQDTEAARNTLVNALETAQKIFIFEKERARSIKDKEQQKDTLEEIARTEAKVIVFINDALKTAEEFENQSEQQNAVLPAIANAHTNVGNSPAVLEIAETMDDSFTQEEKLGFIARAQAEASQTEAARATFASALQIAQGAEPTFRKALALSDVAEELVKVEQKELGVTNARIAHQIAQRINKPMEQAITIAQVAKVLAKAGKRKEAVAIFDSAIEIAQNINIQQERVSIFRVIAQAQTKIEDFAGALQTAQKIEWPWIKAEVLGAIAKAQAAAGQWEESQGTFSIALETPGFFEEEVQVKVLCTRAVVEAARDKAAALETFRELLEFAQESGKQRDNYLSTIAAAHAEAGEISTALKITDEIEYGRERVRALLAIAWEQFKKGEKEKLPTTLAKAFQAKDKIEDEQKRLQALRVIARIQAMAGKGEEAVKTVEAILTERNLHLPSTASWLVETGDRMNFKRLLIPCAYYLDAAYEMCTHLARLYPEKAEEIAKVVRVN